MPHYNNATGTSVNESMVFSAGINAMVSVTENGWQTAETFQARIEHLHKELLAAGVTFPIILELDGHATRYNLDVFRFCITKGM